MHVFSAANVLSTGFCCSSILLLASSASWVRPSRKQLNHLTNVLCESNLGFTYCGKRSLRYRRIDSEAGVCRELGLNSARARESFPFWAWKRASHSMSFMLMEFVELCDM